MEGRIKKEILDLYFLWFLFCSFLCFSFFSFSFLFSLLPPFVPLFSLFLFINTGWLFDRLHTEIKLWAHGGEGGRRAKTCEKRVFPPLYLSV